MNQGLETHILPNDINSGVDRSEDFKNAGGNVVSADGSVPQAAHSKHAQFDSGRKGNTDIDVNDKSQFPDLSEAAHSKVHVDSAENRALNHGDDATVSQAAAPFGGSNRGRTEISGSSHSHNAGHAPDRTARVIGHKENENDDGIAPPDETELLAQQTMRGTHEESDFVNTNISPAERAAREQQSAADRKYQQTHGVRPASAAQYELSEQEKVNLENDKLHHEKIDARVAVKHELQRQIKSSDKDTDKALYQAADEKRNIHNSI